LELAKILKFYFIENGFLKGTDISINENWVCFHSWNEDYSNKDDYESSSLVINDYDIKDKACFNYKENQFCIIKFMIKKFGKPYVDDFKKYIKEEKNKLEQKVIADIKFIKKCFQSKINEFEELESLVK
jgi:hypothetical protein